MNTETQAKHTPGPWEVYRPPTRGTVYEGGEAAATIRAVGSGIHVATMPPRRSDRWTATHAANARLIAAAPENARKAATLDAILAYLRDATATDDVLEDIADILAAHGYADDGEGGHEEAE